MKRLMIATILLLMPMFLFGAADGSEKDIVPRFLNFILFAILLYYFVADPIKDFFNGRSNAIAEELEKVQVKLKESKRSLDIAHQNIVTAQQKAEEIIGSAKREAVILKQKVEESTNRDIDLLMKQYNDAVEFERRRAEQVVIQEVLMELFESDAIKLDQSAYAEILLKKVA